MKRIILINIALMILSTEVLAETISVGNIDNINVANLFMGSSNTSGCAGSTCDFKQTFTENYFDDTNLPGIVTSDYRTSVKSPANANAYIDMAFNGFDIYNGIGNDLVLFFVGNGTSFGLDVFDKNDNILSQGTYNITVTDAVRNSDDTWLCFNGVDSNCTNGFALSAMYIDLGDSVAGDTAIGKLHITFGQNFNGNGSSNFSLAGGFYTQPTVVPLPLPAMLFSFVHMHN